MKPEHEAQKEVVYDESAWHGARLTINDGSANLF